MKVQAKDTKPGDLIYSPTFSGDGHYIVIANPSTSGRFPGSMGDNVVEITPAPSNDVPGGAVDEQGRKVFWITSSVRVTVVRSGMQEEVPQLEPTALKPPSYVYRWFEGPDEAESFVNSQVWEGYELIHLKPMTHVETHISTSYRYMRQTRVEVLMVKYG